MTTKRGNIDFIGIGAGKSGSSWVAQCLQEHPDILFSGQKSKKELRFFTSSQGDDYIKYNRSNYHKGLDWYFKQFPDPKPGKIRGEFSVCYLTDNKAYKRIRQHFPKVKILAVLRNPVDMIYSLYWFCNASVEVRVPEDFNRAVDEGLYGKLYLDKGLYYKHLKKYYDIFPSENIHIIIFEDIKDRPHEVVKNLYQFLGVRDNFVPSILNKKIGTAMKPRFKFIRDFGFYTIFLLRKLGLNNIASRIIWNDSLYKLYYKINIVPQKYPPMPPSTRIKLKRYFQKDIRRLGKLIGRDLSIWK